MMLQKSHADSIPFYSLSIGIVIGFIFKSKSYPFLGHTYFNWQIQMYYSPPTYVYVLYTQTVVRTQNRQRFLYTCLHKPGWTKMFLFLLGGAVESSGYDSKCSQQMFSSFTYCAWNDSITMRSLFTTSEKHAIFFNED